MFSTKEAKVDSGFKTPQFINIGPNELKVTGFEITQSNNGEKFKVQANLETKPLGGDFEGFEGAVGQIGRVDLGIYITGKQDDKATNDFIDIIATIATAMGVKEQVDAIKADSIEDFLNQVKRVFNNKYTWFLIGAVEYMGKDKDGSPKVKMLINLPRYGYVAATEAELQARQKDNTWPDKTNKYFYKALVKMDEDPQQSTDTQSIKDDLPF